MTPNITSYNGVSGLLLNRLMLLILEHPSLWTGHRLRLDRDYQIPFRDRRTVTKFRRHKGTCIDYPEQEDEPRQDSAREEASTKLEQQRRTDRRQRQPPRPRPPPPWPVQPGHCSEVDYQLHATCPVGRLRLVATMGGQASVKYSALML